MLMDVGSIPTVSTIILLKPTLEEKNIKPLYEELKGIQEELPTVSANEGHVQIWDCNVWEGYFKVLDLLSLETGEDFSRFKLEPDREPDVGDSVNLLSLRQCVVKSIKYIGSKYLNQEFNEVNNGGIFINQSQTQKQEQEVYLSISLDLQEKVIKALGDDNISDNEKGFLEKLKSNLGTYTSVVTLFSGILRLMNEFGITADFVARLF